MWRTFSLKGASDKLALRKSALKTFSALHWLQLQGAPLIRLGFFAAVLIATPILADPPQPAIVNAVADIYRPLSPDQETLGGMIGARLRANSEGYIERIGDGAASVADDHIGPLLDAAVYTFEYNRDPHINAVMLRLAKKLIGSQAADGYVGASPHAEQWTAEAALIQSADLRALLNYYRITGDPAALSASTKLGDLLVKQHHKASNDEAGIFAAALEPMVVLFRYTDDSKVLNFCNKVAENWLHKKPPEPPVSHQSLAVLNGLVELYRVNGDNSIFRAPLQSWTEMQASGFTLTGVPAENSGAEPEAPDACTTAAWLEFSADMFRISGQPLYSEQLERMVYNQLFAGQDAKTGAVLAPVTWTGNKQPANGNACAAFEVRTIAELPSIVWGRYGNGIAINLYTAGRVTVRLRRRGTIHFYSETNYPESGTVLLHVEPDHPIHFPLRLRVPEWTDHFTADIGGDHYVGKPGDYLTINRAWKRGDTLKIAIDMNARAIPGVRKFSANVAIARGPQVLVLGKTLNPEITDFDAVTVDHLHSAGLQLSPMTASFANNWTGDQAYSLAASYEGQPRKLVLVPFADGSNYRVWLAKPKLSSAASAP